MTFPRNTFGTRQHWHPQSMLRKFASNGDRHGGIWTLDKQTLCISHKDIGCVCFGAGHFDHSLPDAYSRTADSRWSILEERARKILERMRTTKSLESMSSEDSEVVHQFVSALHFGSKTGKEILNRKFRQDHRNGVFPAGNRFGLTGDNSEFGSVFATVVDQVAFVPDGTHPCRPHMRPRRLRLRQPAQGCEYITSDNPVVVEPDSLTADRVNLALNAPRVRILLPLSPLLLLEMGEACDLGKYTSPVVGSYRHLAVERDDSNDTHNANVMQIFFACNSVFARKYCFLQWAADVIRKSPELHQPIYEHGVEME